MGLDRFKAELSGKFNFIKHEIIASLAYYFNYIKIRYPQVYDMNDWEMYMGYNLQVIVDTELLMKYFYPREKYEKYFKLFEQIAFAITEGKR